MAQKIICDICKKEIGPLDSCRKFKIQQRKIIPFIPYSVWTDIDAHEGCVIALLNAVKDPQPIPPHGGSAQQDN